MKQFCCGRKTLEKTFRLLSVCRGLVKVEGDGARLVRAFSRWQKVGQKGPRDAADDELRRVAGRPGGAGKNWPPPSLAAQSRVIRGAARPYVAPILVRNHDINLQYAEERAQVCP